MKRILLLAVILVSVMGSVFALALPKTKTINTVPNNARIFIGNDEVATGTYELVIGAREDYKIVTVEAEGYISKTVKIFKESKEKSVTIKLEVDEAWSAASEERVDYANKFKTIKVKEGMTEEKAWKKISYAVSEIFPDPEINDKAAGWYRSSWVYKQFNYFTVRTRVEIKQIPSDDELQYKVKIYSEIAENYCGSDDQCFKAWDKVLKTYQQAVKDLINTLN